MRMEEDERPKRYLMWKPEGKRPVGWPKKRWIEVINMALNKRETSLQEVEDFKRYDDRQDWRGLLRGSPTNRW